MDFTRFFLILSVFIGIPYGASADVLSAYFSKDGSRDIFGTTIQVKTADPIVLHRPKTDFEKEVTEEELNEEQQEATTIQLDEVKSDQPQSVEQELIKKYGDPLKEFPVTAIESAPTPFKAMIEALSKGKKEIAFKYALQYTKYRDQLQKINNQATSLIGQSLVREGDLEPNSWASSPEFAEDAYLRHIDLETGELPAKFQHAREDSSQLTDEARAILTSAKNAAFNEFDDAFLPTDSVALELDEEAEREKARHEYLGKIPVDPSGDIDVLYFFEPKDREVQALAKDIERLSESSTKNKAKFMAFTLDRFDTSNVASFQHKTRAKFPISSGESIAQMMKVSESPTVVFIAKNSRSHLKVEGLNNFYYLDEIRAIMQGDRQ